MDRDLERMSREELEALRAQVEDALTSLEVRRKSEARAAAEKAAKDHGFSLDEILTTQKKPKKSPAKYRNPSDPRQTWTGRGRQPGWIKDALSSGKNLREFAI